MRYLTWKLELVSNILWLVVAMRRSKPPTAIARPMLKCRRGNGNGGDESKGKWWKWWRRLKASPIPCCPVNHECSWKKTQIEKKPRSYSLEVLGIISSAKINVHKKSLRLASLKIKVKEKGIERENWLKIGYYFTEMKWLQWWRHQKLIRILPVCSSNNIF